MTNSFAEMLRGGGFEDVDVFTNPVLALEKIGSRHSVYLLVLIGWRMPHLTGPELGLELSKIDPVIKIILFSALDPYLAREWILEKLWIKFDHFSLPVDIVRITRDD